MVDGAVVDVDYKTRSVSCGDDATRTRLETALERIDIAIADAAYAQAMPALSGSTM